MESKLGWTGLEDGSSEGTGKQTGRVERGLSGLETGEFRGMAEKAASLVRVCC